MKNDIGKIKFHYHENPIWMDDVAIDKTIISNKISCTKGCTYFNGYRNEEKGKPFCIILSKMSEYAIIFNKTKCMSFSIEDDKMLPKYNTIWDIVSD